MSVVIETTIGDITVDLFVKERPKACLNFLKLCQIKYYNFCCFHSIQTNLTAQTGDPTGTGSGGESVFYSLYGLQGRFFESELKPKIKHTKKGLISMVNNGEGMHGSQFFLTLSQDLDYLDGIHTVFGHVVEGLDVIDRLNQTICDSEHRPYQDIVITHTVILDDPFPDPKGLEIPPQSPEPSEELLKSNRIAVYEDIDDTEGKTAEEIEEEIRAKEARERALVLEMIGDIPDADVKPPENVLFICKLNPVTREEDLEVIFSRFGTIVSCEVIRDSKSEESLQYAFIEFEKEEDCEKAYFKMDNVLIDDRRIHVDFSQSVSKIKWNGKGKGVTYHDIKGDKQLKIDKFEIKKTAFGQRTDNKYEYVYEERDSDRRRHRDHRVESRKDRHRDRDSERHNRSKRSHRSRSRSRDKKYRNERDSRHRHRESDESQRRRRSETGRRESHQSKRH